jgi:Spy/CpxP family protein refolding chaperone
MGCSRKGSSKMKTKLFFSLLLLAVVVAHGVPATAGEGTGNSHTGTRQSLVAPAEEPAITTVPTGPRTAADDPKQGLQDYDSLMIALTQKFSATLATIAEAAKRGELSSEQAREISAEQYQLTHMQFELLSLWRGFEAQDLSRVPDSQPNPDPGQESDVVTVALPFSSLQLNPSLAKYLNLTPTQVETIQQVMAREQGSFEPLITELRVTGDKLLAIGSEHINAKQLKALADTEASLLARLIVANARMQSTIYKILSPEQQKRLSDLERTEGAVTSDSK